jgi:hypothetical protein
MIHSLIIQHKDHPIYQWYIRYNCQFVDDGTPCAISITHWADLHCHHGERQESSQQIPTMRL